jgi:hypothetical protein
MSLHIQRMPLASEIHSMGKLYLRKIDSFHAELEYLASNYHAVLIPGRSTSSL